MPLELLDPEGRIEVKDSDLTGVTDGDPDTVYVLRPIGIEDHRVLTKQNTRDELDRRSHQKVKVTDWNAVADDVLDFVLIEWRGILFRGAAVPCERDFKLKLDYVRKHALSELAGMNQVARAPERRAESFRQPADVS